MVNQAPDRSYGLDRLRKLFSTRPCRLEIQAMVMSKSLSISSAFRWSAAAGTLRRAASTWLSRGDLSAEQILTALYRGVLEREPDPIGFSHGVDLLRSGATLEQVIRAFIGSPEFRSRQLRAA